MKKRILALVLCVALALPMAACATTAADLPWLHVSTEAFDLPIVAEGTEKDLTIWFRSAGSMQEPELTWTYKFIEEHMNINLEVLAMKSSNQDELLTTAFATGDLPDIIIGSKFDTSDLVRYGVLEEQLLNLSPYLNEEFMPNLTALVTKTPAYRDLITDTDGNVWSVPLIGVTETPDGLARMYMNYDWLEEVNKEVPRTTDEFLDVMRAFKEQDANRYPVGGSWSTYSPIRYLLNAFGYVGPIEITDIALLDGKVVLPAADRKVYGEFVKYMNTLYTEGLLHPDFFTMDSDSTNAMMTQNKNGFYIEAPHLSQDEATARGWWGAYPLTSATNPTAQWPFGINNVSPGGAVVTAACEEPELACVFLDWFFNSKNYANFSFLPLASEYPQYLCGFEGAFVTEDGTAIKRLDFENDPEAQAKYGSGWTWACNWVHMWYNRFGLLVNEETGLAGTIAETVEGPKMLTAADRHNPDLDYKMMYYWSMTDTLVPYVIKDVLSSHVYFDVDTSERISELQIAINEYAEIEFAKFVTGARDLSELDAYFTAIEKLGATELLEIYSEYYGR